MHTKNSGLLYYMTCARVRPYEEVKENRQLGVDFYMKEHSKPLLNNQSIMTVHNLYVYYCANEILKILKYRTPISLYELFKLSDRKDTLLITTSPSCQFVYKSSFIWNALRNILQVYDFSINFGPFKTNLKRFLLNKQKMGQAIEWEDINFVNFFTS